MKCLRLFDVVLIIILCLPIAIQFLSISIVEALFLSLILHFVVIDFCGYVNLLFLAQFSNIFIWIFLFKHRWLFSLLQDWLLCKLDVMLLFALIYWIILLLVSQIWIVYIISVGVIWIQVLYICEGFYLNFTQRFYSAT